MKEKLMLFLKGMVLGAAMIMPGLSGGTLSISMGLYEKIIKTISHFFEDFKENFKFAFNLGIGALVSIAICVLILDYVFEHFPIPAIMLFIGLIIGSLPSLLKEVDYKKTLKSVNLIFIFIGIMIIVGVSLLKESNSVVVLGEANMIQSVKLIGMGVIAAGTIVIPGISGSLVFMVLGYYQPLLNVISETLKFKNIMQNILILLPFGIGIILGGIIIVKMIEFLFKKYKTKTYYVIIGFLMASIVEVFFKALSYNSNLIQNIIAVILLVAGVYLSVRVFKND